MPFQIIRNDITRVNADIIVNTANPEPQFGSGTDAAIYKAAGARELLAERKKIGRIAPGEAAVTSAFQLPAKYIIHTVGPVWRDGNHGEFDILRSCYRKPMLLADQLGCESIAFPLIATGVYGFPKDKALDIALATIREHLEESDLNVILVVFSHNAFQLATGLTERVEEYIDENYVQWYTTEEYGEPFDARLDAIRRRELLKEETDDEWFGSAPERNMAPGMDLLRSAEATFAPALSEVMPAPTEKKKPSLEEVVNNLGESFQARLMRMIDERGMKDPEVYKRANIDRKLFSKIRCSENYIPKKKTIFALAISLRLNLDDARDLLASAGVALTNNNKEDLILRFCIENEMYDIFQIDALFFTFTGKGLNG